MDFRSKSLFGLATTEIRIFFSEKLVENHSCSGNHIPKWLFSEEKHLNSPISSQNPVVKEKHPS